MQKLPDRRVRGNLAGTVEPAGPLGYTVILGLCGLLMRESRATWLRQLALAAWAAGLALGMGGCVEPAGKQALDNPDSLVKIRVLKEISRDGGHDARTLARVVEELDNRDPAVRFYAIAALRTVTGQTFGYRYYDEETARQPAIEKWRQWLADQGRSGPVAGHGQ